MSNRVNWSAIFAGALIGIGGCLCLALISRAWLINNTDVNFLAEVPYRGGEAAAALVFSVVAFSLAGMSTVLLGRFPLRADALLHALGGFLLAAVFIHYATAGALFIGRPGFPVGWAPGALRAGAQGGPLLGSDLAVWTTAISALLGLLSTGVSSWLTFDWLANGRLWGSKLSRREYERRPAA